MFDIEIPMNTMFIIWILAWQCHGKVMSQWQCIGVCWPVLAPTIGPHWLLIRFLDTCKHWLGQDLQKLLSKQKTKIIINSIVIQFLDIHICKLLRVKYSNINFQHFSFSVKNRKPCYKHATMLSHLLSVAFIQVSHYCQIKSRIFYLKRFQKYIQTNYKTLYLSKILLFDEKCFLEIELLYSSINFQIVKRWQRKKMLR